ncbi:MAG: hydrolase 2, exosortase A system-associated [Betaproteobacteria bacterium]|nr:hydrolase 2, exosortase A system-associated [Betaproteobacteria bacterium]
MLGTTSSLPHPFFLPSSLGRIFAVYHAPVGATKPWGNVLVVPAFNEEMNRCRSMVTTQAQALAKLGVGTLAIDLFGTGESDGEYGDARWGIWIENVRQGIEWLDEKPGGGTGLLGIRLGVALALAALQQDHKKRALIAWQPIVDGKSCLTQFMRMRIAANMDRTDIPKDTTAGMRAQLAEGRSIEVAGYEIHPELAMSIESLRLSELIPPESVSIAWLEKGGGEENEISPASKCLLAAWQPAGRTTEVIPFDGPAFWALYERFLAPDLVKKTSDWVQLLRPTK